MTLKEEIFNFKIQFVTNLYETMGFIARKFFDYPNVPGMRIRPKAQEYKALVDYVRGLPNHETRCPPPPSPSTLTDVLFGNIPQFDKITRAYYQHKYDGFYNIQIPDYKNIWFLPEWLSRWIQLNLEITVDVSPLEHIQQAIFVAITMYYFVVEFRVKLFWFLTINPYTRPWVYLLSLTDWLMDWVNGLAPTVFSIDISPMVVLGIFGKLGDALNHLVFTMPFLPSEGTLGNVMVDGKVKHIILYRYLPSLWAQQPIPNKLREFWYTQRPDILKYMKKNYSQLDIDFEPDRILQEIYNEAKAKEEIRPHSAYRIRSQLNELKQGYADGRGVKLSRWEGVPVEQQPWYQEEKIEPIPGPAPEDWKPDFWKPASMKEIFLDPVASIKQFSSNVICDISSSSHHSVDHFVSDSKHLISELLN